MKAKVFIGIPTYDNKILAETLSAVLACKKNPEISAEFRVFGFSALTTCFNILYAEALNGINTRGFTHFAMLHADVFPEAYWLDKLVEIMDRFGADVVSGIIPIKDDRGVTSTAIETGDKFRPKRFTLKELHKMPESFSTDNLLLNTGCMLIDIRKDWAKKICFRFINEINEVSPGVFKEEFLSEDWLFSREARALGAKLVATREIKLIHIGTSAFPNDSAWGSLSEDVDDGKTQVYAGGHKEKANGAENPNS